MPGIPKKYNDKNRWIVGADGELIEMKGRLGSPTQRTAETIGNAATTDLTITGGKKDMLVQNTGSNSIYMGNSSVTSANGFQMYSATSFLFENVNDSFTVSFICAAGQTSTLRIVEF